MKKGPAQQVPEPVAAPTAIDHTEPAKEVPQSGYGRFEYINGTMYAGNWKLHNGAKVKHGHGKITYPSAGASSDVGVEEYEGDWEEDLMHGYGVYKYTSGAAYTGQWHKGKQQG
jgi:hypothetical protein